MTPLHLAALSAYTGRKETHAETDFTYRFSGENIRL